MLPHHGTDYTQFIVYNILEIADSMIVVQIVIQNIVTFVTSAAHINTAFNPRMTFIEFYF